MLTPLSSTRLIFVTGKGGVGKSTVSAALAAALAARGKRVLVAETDAFSAMADLFGVRKDIRRDPAEVEAMKGNLELINLSAEEALISAIRQFVPSERVARTVIQNRVARVFFNAAPSVNEFSILNRVRSFLELKRSGSLVYDHVIVDLPASGHAVTYLSVPRTLHGMIRVGALARLNDELAAVIEDPAQCAVLAVALPEELPVQETIELADSFRAVVKRPVSLVMLNMVHHAPFAPEHRAVFDALEQHAQGAELPPELERLITGNALALDWYERDLKYSGILREALDVPIVEIPAFYEHDGKQIVARMSDHFNSGDDARASASQAS